MSDEKKIDRIEDKIDIIVERIGSIDVTIAKQSIILEDHTRRSLANEEAVKILSQELKPIISHVTIMKFAGRIIVFLLSSKLVYDLLHSYFQ